MTEWLTIILLIVGTGFTLTSSIGLLRLPDFYTRLHAPTKAATLGVSCILLGALVYFGVSEDRTFIREVLAIGFLFVTAPVSTHMLAKAARAIGVPSHSKTRDHS